MSHFKKTFISVFLSILLIPLLSPVQSADAFSDIPIIILSQYKTELDIGEQCCVLAFTSNGKQATWKSSDSKIASVNTYGVVTAKKAGIAVITAKIKNAEASCEISVNKTLITLSKTAASIEHGENLKLSAITSNGSKITWKSNKKSIAIVDEYGKVTGIKPGEAIITATADGSSTSCILTVKLPTVELNTTSATIYRGQSIKLSASVSSGVSPTWKTNKKSVAIVDATGTVTAMKNGTAIITATVDGVSKTCEITVQKPIITLSATELTLGAGNKATLTALVSSGNLPVWSTSNSNIITVSSKGELKALQKGKAYVYATEDGTKARCTVIVTE